MLISRLEDPVSVSLGGGERAMLSTRNDSYITLNETAAVIWDMLETPCEFDDLMQGLLERYKADRSEIEPEVRNLLKVMEQRRLIAVSRP